MSKFLLLSLFLFCSLPLLAQIDAQKGTLTLTNNQTLSGNIVFYTDNPSEVIFYDSTGTKHAYLAIQVNNLQLDNGKLFRAKTLTHTKDVQVVIAEAIVESEKISLYKFQDPNLRYFVEKKGTMYPLENNVSVILRDGTYHRKSDYQYMGVLNTLMADRPDLVDDMKKVKLEEKDLTKLVLDYTQNQVLYQSSTTKKKNRDPYWAVYGQFNNHVSYLLFLKMHASSQGYQIGAQYHFSKDSRTSIKLPLDYAHYAMEDRTYKASSLALKFQYDFVMKERYNVYFLLHLADVSYINREFYRYERVVNQNSSMVFVPRFSPGWGFQIKPGGRLSGFAEINHLIRIESLPKNFSLGLKYTLSN